MREQCTQCIKEELESVKDFRLIESACDILKLMSLIKRFTNVKIVEEILEKKKEITRTNMAKPAETTEGVKKHEHDHEHDLHSNRNDFNRTFSQVPLQEWIRKQQIQNTTMLMINWIPKYPLMAIRRNHVII